LKKNGRDSFFLLFAQQSRFTTVGLAKVNANARLGVLTKYQARVGIIG